MSWTRGTTTRTEINARNETVEHTYTSYTSPDFPGYRIESWHLCFTFFYNGAACSHRPTLRGAKEAVATNYQKLAAL